MRKIIASACLLLFVTPLLAVEPSPTLERGREMTGLFLQGKIGAVWQRMGPVMQQALGSEARLQAFREQVGAQLGEETEVLEERTQRIQGADVYLRIGRWTRVERIQVQWAFDEAGRVVGFFVRPDAAPRTAAPSKFLDYQTRAALRLPFEGEWFVFWGGRTLAQNYHAASRSQRFAHDLVIRKDGKSHSGDGKALTDYYCYGAPLLAPGDGVVAWTEDQHPDQAIGTTNAANPIGNGVVIDHGNGEFSLLAHMQPNSLLVKKGDRVKRGQKLGLCGNSGNTSEPHVHYHLQNGPEMREADGLPAFFHDLVVDGKPVARAEIVKGQSVKAAAAAK